MGAPFARRVESFCCLKEWSRKRKTGRKKRKLRLILIWRTTSNIDEFIRKGAKSENIKIEVP